MIVFTKSEEEATAFANENWMEFFDPSCGDYKHAWCEAYDEYMINLELEGEA